MSFRNWFKGAKVKALVVLGSFALLLGVGASVSVAQAAKENETVETKAFAGGKTVYFTSPNAIPKIHYWGSAGSTEWPGTAMTLAYTNDQGENVYSFNLPSGDLTGMVFHDTNGHQCNDITTAPGWTLTGYYLTQPTWEKSDAGTWQVLKDLSITYNSNGGSGTMSSQTSLYRKSKVTVSTNTFTRTGYVFTGWNTKANGSGDPYSNGSLITLSTSSVTLFAQWKRANGFYLLGPGVGATWSIDDSSLASMGDDANSSAYWTGVSIVAGQGYKAVYYNGSSVEWCEGELNSGSHNANTTWTGGNAVTSVAGTYKIYLSKTGENPAKTLSVNMDITYTCYEVYLGNTTEKGTMTGNTDVTLATTLSEVSPFVSHEGYAITGYYSNSTCTASLTPGSYYPTASMNVYAKYEPITVTITLDKQTGSGGQNSVSATYGASMPTITVPTRTGYTFGGYYSGTSGSGTKYYNADGTSAHLSDFVSATTIYAKWTINNYTVTYKYRSTDGEDNIKSDTSTSADYNTSVTLPSGAATDISGYNFYGWYTSYSAGLFSGYIEGGSYNVTASVSLWGRYIKNGYTYLCSSTNDLNPTSAWRFTDSSPSSGYRSFTRSFALNETFYVFDCSSGGDTDMHWSDMVGGDASHHFAYDSNNFKCTTAGSYQVVVDMSTKKISIYYAYEGEGYYMAGEGTFGSPNWSLSAAAPMDSTSSAVGVNTAILENGVVGTSVAKDTIAQVWYNPGFGAITKYSMSLGDTYDFATDIGDNIQITKAGSYNFYFKATSSTEGVLYIVDVSIIAKAGTLYLSTPASVKGDVSVTVTNTKGEHPIDGSKGGTLTNVEGCDLVSSTLKFQDGFVFSVPIFNLRGADSGAAVTDVTFEWSAGSVSLSSVGDLGGNSEQYMIINADGTVSETEYDAFVIALDIDDAIKAAGNQSVCNVAQEKAVELCESYDAASSDFLAAATIKTWNSIKPTYSGDKFWTLAEIRVELGNRAGGDYVIATASIIPGAPKGNESPLTLTLWMVLGAGVLGLGAIGTAYFVSKKKRHQA